MTTPLLQLVETAEDSRTVDAENPWPGLWAFRERDEGFFFGRDKDESVLLQRILRQRLTILYGRPGAGKTSLLRAGIFPRLSREGILPVRLRLSLDPTAPLLSLQVREELRCKAAKHEVEVPPVDGTETLWEYLHQKDAHFWDRESLLVIPLLVFDQFEEILTHVRQEGSRAKDCRDFLNELAALVEGHAPADSPGKAQSDRATRERFARDAHPYKVLISLREDSLAELDGWCMQQAPSGLGHHRYWLLAMTGEAALEAVKLPGKELIEETVAGDIVRWVAGAAGERTSLPTDTPLSALKVEPALLSLFCRELNNDRIAQKKKTISLGQTQRESILDKFYENCLRGVSLDVRKFVEDKLLTPQGDRRDSEALQALDPPPTPEFLEDLKALHTLRLLRIEWRDRLDRVELTHDVLIPVVKASRDRRRPLEQLERQWQKQHEGEKKRRRRRAVFALSVFALLALTGAVVGFSGFMLAQESARLERESKYKAVAAQHRAETALAQADGRAAASLVDSGRAAEGLAYLAHAVKTDPGNLFARSSILSLLLRKSWPLPLSCVAPVGKLLAAGMDATGKAVAASAIPRSGPAGGQAQGIRLWEAAGDCARSVQRDIPLGFSPSSAALSSQGTHLVVAAGDGHWAVVQIPELQPRVSAAEAGITDLEISPSGRLVAFTTTDSTVEIWNTESLRRVGPPLPLGIEVSTLAFSPDDRLLAVAATDYVVRLWRVGEASPRFFLQHQGVVRCIRFDAASRRLVTASADQQAYIWDSRTGELLTTLTGHHGVVRWAEFSPDGRNAATASWDRTARLWSVATGKQLGHSLRHQGRVQSVRFSPDGRLLLTASSDSTARVWDVRKLGPVGEPMRLTGALTWADFTADGKALTISPQIKPSSQPTTPEQVTLWDVQPGDSRPYRTAVPRGAEAWSTPPSIAAEMAAEPEPIAGIAVDWEPSQQLLAILRGRVLRLWKLLHGPPEFRQIEQNLPFQGVAASVALSPGGQRAVLAWNPPGAGKAIVRLIDLGSSRTVAEIPGSNFASVAFSPDGASLLLAHWDGTLELHDARDGASRSTAPYLGKLRDRVLNREERLASAQFAPDGSTVVTGSWDWSARFLDPRTGKPIGPPMRHLGRVFSAFYGGTHGELAVTASADATARVWTAAKAEPLTDLLRHQAPVWSARLSPGGGRVVTTSADGRVRLWDTASSQQIGEPFESIGPVVAAFFAQSDALLTVADDGTVQLWDAPHGLPSDSTLLQRLAEAVGGYRIEDGIVKPAADRIALLEGLRRETTPERPAGSSLQVFLEWFFEDRVTRLASPIARNL